MDTSPQRESAYFAGASSSRYGTRRRGVELVLSSTLNNHATAET